MSTLFLAEDDQFLGEMYQKVFKIGGHELTLAHDGEEALTLLSQMNPKPKLVLLDVMMPKMSGFDVLRKMEADESLKNIPVVFLTNLAGEEDAKKGISLGALLYLIKSQYTPKQIVEKVEEVMKSNNIAE